MSKEVTDKLKALMPHMVNKIAGHEIMLASSSSIEQQISSLIESLSPGKIDQIILSLEGDERAAMTALLKSRTDHKEEADDE